MAYKLPREVIEEIENLALQDYTYNQIAETLNINPKTAFRYVNEACIRRYNKLNQEITEEKIKELILQNKSTTEIARFFGVEASSFRFYLCNKKISLRNLKVKITKELMMNGYSNSEIAQKLGITLSGLWIRRQKMKE